MKALLLFAIIFLSGCGLRQTTRSTLYSFDSTYTYSGVEENLRVGSKVFNDTITTTFHVHIDFVRRDTVGRFQNFWMMINPIDVKLSKLPRAISGKSK